MNQGFSSFTGQQNWVGVEQPQIRHPNWGQRQLPRFQGNEENFQRSNNDWERPQMLQGNENNIPIMQNNWEQTPLYHGIGENFSRFQNVPEYNLGLQSGEEYFRNVVINREPPLGFQGNRENYPRFESNMEHRLEFQGKQGSFQNPHVRHSAFQQTGISVSMENNQEGLPMQGIHGTQDNNFHNPYTPASSLQRSVEPSPRVENNEGNFWEHQPNFNNNGSTPNAHINQEQPSGLQQNFNHFSANSLEELAPGMERNQDWPSEFNNNQEQPGDVWDRKDQAWGNSEHPSGYGSNQQHQPGSDRNNRSGWKSRTPNVAAAAKLSAKKRFWRKQLEKEADETKKLFNPAWKPNVKRWTPTERRMRRKPKKLCTRTQYRSGNFRGALHEHFGGVPGKKGVKIEFETAVSVPEDYENTQISYISFCRVTGKKAGFKHWEGSEIKPGQVLIGTGRSIKKKSSIHFAALDIILQLGLTSMVDHLKCFPGLSRCYKNKPVDTADDQTANKANEDEDSVKTVVLSKPEQVDIEMNVEVEAKAGVIADKTTLAEPLVENIVSERVEEKTKVVLEKPGEVCNHRNKEGSDITKAAELVASASISVGTLALENGLETQEKLKKDPVAPSGKTDAQIQDGEVTVKIISNVEPTIGIAAKTIELEPVKAIIPESVVEKTLKASESQMPKLMEQKALEVKGAKGTKTSSKRRKRKLTTMLDNKVLEMSVEL